MGIFQITAFLILIFFIAYQAKEELISVVPVSVGILVLFLYVLSFFNALSFSDYAAVAAVVLAMAFFIRMKKEKRREILLFIKTELLRPGTITAFFMAVTVTVLVGAKITTWWDDYNFWATDVKSIFYLDGFAGKYRNAAPEFGDYPPGTQMMKWWFLHFSPNEFKEGLMFAGYYFMNLAFLFPLLKYLKKKNVLLMLLSAAALFLFPTAVEVFGCDGCCADLTMAVIYGAFLMAVMDRKGHSLWFYYGRQAIFLMVLVLCKNVGFLWVGFALLFACGYHFFVERKGIKLQRGDKWGFFLVAILPVLTEASWLLFCFGNRRVAKLTGTALQMAAGSMNLPDYQSGMVKAFAEAFIKWPLHRWSTAAIDLTPLALFLLLPLFVFLLYLAGKLTKRQAVYTGSFFCISGICFYAINLVSHLTIFAVESQYLEPYGMVSSIERYGAPFTVGGLYLIAYLCLDRKPGAYGRERGLKQGRAEGLEKSRAPGLKRPFKAERPGEKKWKKGKAVFQSVKRFFSENAGVVFCLLFVFLTADYNSAWRSLVSYRETAAPELARREELVDEAAENFLNAINQRTDKDKGRVLYLRDSSDVSWVRNTYVNFEAAPVSVMYGAVDAGQTEAREIEAAVRDADAEYVYIDSLKGDGQALLSAFTGGEEFEFGSLYRADWENNSLSLTPAEMTE